MRLPRLTLFWRLQLIGWTAFAICTLPLKLTAFETVPLALIITFTREPLGFILSSLLRYVYRELKGRDLSTLRTGLAVVAASALAGLIDTAIGRQINAAAGQPESQMVSLGIFCIRSITYVAWSMIYFWAKEQHAAQQRALTLAQAETARREAELQLLRAQVNPHFLFNALNTIMATLEPEHHAPKRVVEGLAGYLRYSLNHRHDSLVPLGAEFDAALSYLAVEQARFRGELLITSVIDSAARTVLVPGVILQPLIENAVKYSRDTSEPPYQVKLDVQLDASGRVRIEVANTGTWREPSGTPGPHGTGLENLRRRLALLYPERHRLTPVSTDGWVHIRLVLDAKPTLSPAAPAAVSP